MIKVQSQKCTESDSKKWPVLLPTPYGLCPHQTLLLKDSSSTRRNTFVVIVAADEHQDGKPGVACARRKAEGVPLHGLF